jgi:plastocyanin
MKSSASRTKPPATVAFLKQGGGPPITTEVADSWPESCLDTEGRLPEMKTFLSCALFALSSSIPALAAAGVIQGTLRVPPPVRPAVSPNAYPGSAASMAGAHEAQHGLASDAVIFVDQVPAAAESALAAAAGATPKLAQKGQMFVPRVIVVAVDGNVEFPNQDPIYHNVFSLSPVRRFDLGKYPKGSSRTVNFPKPGLVNVYCDIHSNMEAFILVLPHHAFARPKPSGEFRLPDLPAGAYVLHAWHPDLGEQMVSVQVPATGVVTADPSYPQ